MNLVPSVTEDCNISQPKTQMTFSAHGQAVDPNAAGHLRVTMRFRMKACCRLTTPWSWPGGVRQPHLDQFARLSGLVRDHHRPDAVGHAGMRYCGGLLHARQRDLNAIEEHQSGGLYLVRTWPGHLQELSKNNTQALSVKLTKP